MNCSDCKFWFRGTRRQYKNSPVVFTASASGEQGICRSGGAVNGLTIGPTFGCIDFSRFSNPDEQEDFIVYDAEPWQISEEIRCPDCNGYGCGCHRCASTGHVRKYADGYVGDEQTKEHPVERRMRLEKQRQVLMERMRAELAELEKDMMEVALVKPEKPLALSGSSDPFG